MESSQNWLGFTLSNLHHYQQNQHQHKHMTSDTSSSTTTITSSPLSLLEAFDSTNPPGRGDGAGPKLEDFLGGGGGSSSSSTMTTTTTAVTAVSGGLIRQFHVESAVPDSPSTETYDSELKKIAASFLRGFSADHNNNNTPTNHQQQQLTAALSDPAAAMKTVDNFGQRTSIYRGVTRHRWTGRYEAHLWDNSCRREGQSRKGRQVYLGGYDKEEKAARAYDLAALKYWGPSTTTNFPISNYEKELREMKNMTRQEFVASLRRRSSGFSRGASIYRGVTRHHQHGRWQARIGRVAGNKDLYLGTFSTQEEAAEAYDIAAIKFRGLNAVTNFDMSRYDVKSIAKTNLPFGGISGGADPNKTSSESISDDRNLSSAAAAALTFSSQQPTTTVLSFAVPILKPDTSTGYWALFGSSSPYQSNYPPMNGVVSPQALVQSQSSKPFFSIDFPASSRNMDDSVMSQSENGFLAIGGGNSNYVPSNGSTGYAAPNGANNGGGCSVNSTSCDAGSWATTPFHTFQTSKPTSVASMFHLTPIYGMK